MVSSSIFIYMMHIICYCRCSDGTKVSEGTFRPLGLTYLVHGPEKSGQRKMPCDTVVCTIQLAASTNPWHMWGMCSEFQIDLSIVHKHSSIYHKFPCQILSLFYDDAGLLAQQISSFWWYLTYHVSALIALLENVLRYPYQCWNSIHDLYEAIPKKCNMHFFLIWNCVPNSVWCHPQ